MIPFASDLGGNKICVNTQTHEIFVIYMDLGDPLKEKGAIRKIAPCFTCFIENLEEAIEEDV